jgi:integrase
MGASFKFIIRKQALKLDGTTNIYIRFIVDRKVQFIKTNINVLPNNFLLVAQQVSKKDVLHHEKNFCINEISNNITKRILQHEQQNSPLFLSDLIEAYKQKNNIDLMAYTIQLCEQKKLTRSRKSQVIKSVSYLLAFNPKANLYNLTTSTILGFKNHLSNTLAKNTVISQLSRIRSVYNAAFNDGVIKYKPFDKVAIGVGTNKQLYFTKDEVFALVHKMNFVSESKQKILSAFLFGCFTGLRFSDLLRLKIDNVKAFDNKYYIEFVQGKTKVKNIVPLNNYALKYIDKTANKYLFPQLTNQHYNRELKEIAEQIGFEKYISFHISRHTFITLSQQIGISLSDVSKIAGHTNIKTTQGYTHHNLSSLFDSISKWN